MSPLRPHRMVVAWGVAGAWQRGWFVARAETPAESARRLSEIYRSLQDQVAADRDDREAAATRLKLELDRLPPRSGKRRAA